MGAMLVIAIGMLVYFRRRGWIGWPRRRRSRHHAPHRD
jgi:hypothetical protein